MGVSFSVVTQDGETPGTTVTRHGRTLVSVTIPHRTRPPFVGNVGR